MDNLEVCIKPTDFAELEDMVTITSETIADAPNVIRVNFRCKNGYSIVYHSPVFYSPSGLQISDSQTQLGVTISIPAASIMTWLPPLLNKLQDTLASKFGSLNFNYALTNDLFVLPVNLNAVVFDRITQVPLQHVKTGLFAQSQLPGPGYYMARIHIPGFQYSGKNAVLQMRTTQLLYQPAPFNDINNVKLLLPLDKFPSPPSGEETFIHRPEMQIPPLEAINLPKPLDGLKAPTSSPAKTKTRRKRVVIKPPPSPPIPTLTAYATANKRGSFDPSEEDDDGAAIEAFLEELYTKNKP